jgi:hypothetical protein
MKNDYQSKDVWLNKKDDIPVMLAEGVTGDLLMITPSLDSWRLVEKSGRLITNPEEFELIYREGIGAIKNSEVQG